MPSRHRQASTGRHVPAVFSITECRTDQLYCLSRHEEKRVVVDASIKIRTARPEDASRLHELHAASVRALCAKHYSKDIIEGWLQSRTPSGYLPPGNHTHGGSQVGIRDSPGCQTSTRARRSERPVSSLRCD